MKKTFYLLIIMLSVLIMISCGTTTQVSRVTGDEIEDLSGRWNANDSRSVSQQMITSMLSSQWLDSFRMEEDKAPRIIIGKIRNLSDEHIETSLFMDDIEREITNSGKAKFVSTRDERNDIREERFDQQSYASDATAKDLANETAADFMLMGSIKSVRDAVGGEEMVTFKVDLELIDIETNEKVWLETLPLHKKIYRSKAKF